jgi:hypothetical protein
MPKRSLISVSGTVTAIFGHRFVIQSGDSKHLADIGPDAAGQIRLTEGDDVRVTGERQSSEIKVSEIVKAGGRAIRIAHQTSMQETRAEWDARAVIEAITRHGFDVVTQRRPAKGSAVKVVGMIPKYKPAAIRRPKPRSAAATKLH